MPARIPYVPQQASSSMHKEPCRHSHGRILMQRAIEVCGDERKEKLNQKE